jgi:hypothetical protein
MAYVVIHVYSRLEYHVTIQLSYGQLEALVLFRP